MHVRPRAAALASLKEAADGLKCSVHTEILADLMGHNFMLLEVGTLKFFSPGGDQGVLNGFFNNWATADISKHLPFIYNLSSVALYTYLPAFKR